MKSVLIVIFLMLVYIELNSQQKIDENHNIYPFFLNDAPAPKSAQFIGSEHKRNLWKEIKIHSKQYSSYGNTNTFSENIEGNWEYIGPLNSNNLCGVGRFNHLAISPADSNYLLGASASGGVWRSKNGGLNWLAVSDNLSFLGVTKIVFNPKNPNEVYMATGDADGGSALSFGLLKSTDSGINWDTTSLSYNLTNLEYIRDIIIQPDSVENILAATNKNVYFSTDGFKTYKITHTGDHYSLERHPKNPRIVYLSTMAVYNGSPARILISYDAGRTWDYCDNEISDIRCSKFKLATSIASPDKIYAMGLKDGTDSAGLFIFNLVDRNWTVPENFTLFGYQGWYNFCLAVSPSDSNKVFFGAVWLWKSSDAGKSWKTISEWAPVHCDHHALVFRDNCLYSCNDGGIWKTYDEGLNWTNLNNDIAAQQFYRMDVCRKDSMSIGAGAQDNCFIFKCPTTNYEWKSDVGGDIMGVIFSSDNANEIYVNGMGMMMATSNGGQNWLRVPENLGDFPLTGNWITPYLISYKNNSSFISGYKNVWKSDDKCKTWTKISPELVTGTNIDQLDWSKSDTNVIYASYYNKLFVTIDGGKNWIEQTQNLNVYDIISRISVSPDNPLDVWISLNSYFYPQRVLHSTDAGYSWKDESYNLPEIPVTAILVSEDSEGTVYAGTIAGLYSKIRNSKEWIKENGLPNAQVTDIKIINSGMDVYISTYGRGMWHKHKGITSIGTANNQLKTEIKIFPVPSYSFINIRINNNNDINSNFECKIYNLYGELIYSFTTSQERTIDISNWQNGFYYAAFNNCKETIVLKFIKQ